MAVIYLALPFLCHWTWPSQEHFLKGEERYPNDNVSELKLDLLIKDVLALSFCKFICTWASSQGWSLINPISDAQMSIWLLSCSLILHILCISAYKTHVGKNRDWAPELLQSHPSYSPEWLKELFKQEKYSPEDGKWKQKQFALESKLMGTKPVAL